MVSEGRIGRRLRCHFLPWDLADLARWDWFGLVMMKIIFGHSLLLHWIGGASTWAARTTRQCAHRCGASCCLRRWLSRSGSVNGRGAICPPWPPRCRTQVSDMDGCGSEAQSLMPMTSSSAPGTYIIYTTTWKGLVPFKGVVLLAVVIPSGMRPWAGRVLWTHFFRSECGRIPCLPPAWFRLKTKRALVAVPGEFWSAHAPSTRRPGG